MSTVNFGFGLFNFFCPLYCYSFVPCYFIKCLFCCENESAMFLLVVIILIKAGMSLLVYVLQGPGFGVFFLFFFSLKE